MKDKIIDLSGITGKVYVIGPMEGFHNFNFDAFDAATCQIRECGLVPISPVHLERISEGWGKLPPAECDMPYMDRTSFMRRGANILLDMDPSKDGVYLLKGWRKSKIARAENALANFKGLKIIREAVA